MNFFSGIGTAAYFLGLPALRFFLRKTTRAYVIIEHEHEVLVIKNLLGRKQWHLPGGGIKKYESSKLAVIREVWEEVGVELEPAELKEITTGKWASERLNFPYTVFRAKLSEKPEKLDIKKPEIIEAKWLPTSKIVKNTPAEIKSALEKL
jgi:8-oxo-dGTP pyrophosphatase MutT (NUDIX family)